MRKARRKPTGSHLRTSPVLEIETERYGTQILSLYLRPLKSWSMIEIPKTFTLQPVGRLTGRVDAKNLEAVRGHVLRLTTHDWSKVDALISMGSALVKIAADGTFEVPALAEGQLQLRSSFEGTPNRVDSSFKLLPAIKAGESAQVTIPLRLGVTITGLVREKGTNRPIPGLVVLIGSRQRDDPGSDRRRRALPMPGSARAGVSHSRTPQRVFPARSEAKWAGERAERHRRA